MTQIWVMTHRLGTTALDHSILLENFYVYSFRGLSGHFISSFLTNRNEYDHFNSTISSTLHIKYGISQGSVLGPILLLLLCINDLSNIQYPCHFTLFAYDTTNKNMLDLENIINETLVFIHEYLITN